MRTVRLACPDDLDAFRQAARGLIAAGAAPETVSWQEGEEVALPFGNPVPDDTKAPPLSVPKRFHELAEPVICHRDPERFALLYIALWRLGHGERSLLQDATNPLVRRLERMAGAVDRDEHRMTAFLRFRRIETDGAERFVAWFEPEHYILRRAAPFFIGRFAAMRWSILTPDGSLHWDGGALDIGPGMRREDAPDEDSLEDAWRRYYAATFNPARANPVMMRSEMPKRYWRNLPEAGLIPELLDGAPARTRAMIAATAEPPRKAIPAPGLHEPGPAGTLAGLASEIAACRRCPLHGPATQPVFGEGPPDAPVVFLGEQPGDQEDLAGRVFVGPAGQLFERALAEAGIDRARIYVTNAVKHFKYQVRGKRRIHQRPNSGEVEACRWWVERELSLIRPRLAVALGATAARSLSGHAGPLSALRGRPLRFRDDLPGLVTVHPSYLLRLPDPAAQEAEHRRFVAELRQAAALVPEIRQA
ncbi:UdgX family uracil-DNA binding protein [Mycobacterium sp. KBS0706]|uniref:UdgX family uracil-DNA binding protein n=1 Tax=Mycobacterium sp. KBS0706 TaxID=2578109 RepID=UPI00110FCCAC|nr:UdgX family uracil-DNA binding protein [Mycobacterium sp. KBS0706]TSD86993.1 UdgX family uracil-DNA binding protein [Mycobacterium sp. KBS0706]